jgi:hypothetical protein
MGGRFGGLASSAGGGGRSDAVPHTEGCAILECGEMEARAVRFVPLEARSRPRSLVEVCGGGEGAWRSLITLANCYRLLMESSAKEFES